jgi:hypothetical protein
MKPVSLVPEIRRLSRKKPDFIWMPTNTTHVITVIKAQKELGLKIPILAATHNGIQMSTMASKDINLLEGHYDSGAVDPGIDTSLPGAIIVNEYCQKLNMKSHWSALTIQAVIMNLLAVRAVERAAATVGPENITGEAMYNAMYVKPFTEKDLLGLASTLTFTKQAPFSTKDLKVKATTVKNGKQVLVSQEWIPVPEIPKWVKKK